jgi:hypothetical protein
VCVCGWLTWGQVGLGTLPLELSVFTSPAGKPSVFAACDRPAVVYASGDKVLLSNVNVASDVKHAVAFHSQAFPGCLVRGLVGGALIPRAPCVRASPPRPCPARRSS